MKINSKIQMCQTLLLLTWQIYFKYKQSVRFQEYSVLIDIQAAQGRELKIAVYCMRSEYWGRTKISKISKINMSKNY